LQTLVVTDKPSRAIRVEPSYPDPQPGAEEVKVRVHLAGICATDLEIARGYMQFAGVPGHEFVGTVVVGDAAWVGRRVVAEINCVCLTNHCRRRTVLGIAGRDGAFAEYLVVPARNCHEVPDGVTDQQAVFVEPLAAAVHVLDALPPQRARVAVLGSGRLGLLVAQVLARQDGRLEVIGRNPRTLAVCSRHAIEARHVDDIVPAGEHDCVVDCTGAPEGLALAMKLCRPCGMIVLKSTCAEPAAIDLAPAVVNELHIVGNRCGSFPPALQLLAEHRIEVDGLVSAVYPLEQGAAALEAAARPDHIKVLLRPGPP